MGTARRLFCLVAFTGVGVVVPAGLAWATQMPTTGQPGAPNVTCFTIGEPTALSPGHATTAPGSVFNPNGTSGTVYAGNPSTASLAHSNSTAAVSQYDVACLQFTAAH